MTPIESLIVVEEAHLSDPKGNVERRLATITEDRQQVERNPLEVPSPKPSSIVRNWPDAMWNDHRQKEVSPDGHVSFCSTGILHEVAGGKWNLVGRCGDGTVLYATSLKEIGAVYGLTCDQLSVVQCMNDLRGKDAAADLLESWGF